MKLLLVLVCLLLCGCAKEAPEPTVPPATTLPPEAAPVSMYAPNHALENQYEGALKVYPLTMRKVLGIRPIEDDLLVFSGYGSTTLTLLTGEELLTAGEVTLDFELDPQDPSIQILEGTISYYDPNSLEMVILGRKLEEIRRIPLPNGLLGSPIFSEDRSILYYCTSEAIVAWDLESSIHRRIKELSYEDQRLTGLHCGGTVLQCRILDGQTVKTLFLSTESGLLLSQQSGDIDLVTVGERYYAKLPVSEMERLVFGTGAEAPMVLYPEDPAAEAFFLPVLDAVVTASILPDEQVQLHCYALSSGTIRAALTLDPLQSPKAMITDAYGAVNILIYDPANDCDVIYRWESTAPVFAPASEGETFTDAYSGTEEEDSQLLAQCQSLAAQLSDVYGIQILVGGDAAAVQPWDYEFLPETLPRVLLQELRLLDQRLSQYPKSVLSKTASHFASLKLCLVRQISGTAASGSLATATGIQFFDGTDAYVVISVGKYSQQALYHELYHVMETHILNESSALDQWSDWNPQGFDYSYGYDPSEEYLQYLSGENQAFVDSYSMTFPKEDRARVFENAMLPGNTSLFSSQTMQRKLTAICESIRQAYGLRKSPEAFPWEQYLTQSLAYTE